MDEEKEVYRSIFDAASKLEKHKGKAEALTAGEADAAAQVKPPPLTPEEMKAKFEECKKMHNQLADKLEQAFVKSNLTPKKLHDYLNTPQNFTDTQWRQIEAQKKAVDGMLARLAPKGALKKSPEKKEKEDDTVESKGKKPTKMQSRSRWISMH